MSESNAFNKFKESTSEFLNWASSGPLVQSTANFLSHPVKTIKNVGQDVKAAFTGKDSRQASFSAVDDNGDIYEYSLPSSGYVYKTPSGNHVSHRGYAYLTAGEDGRLKLNVSKSVAESDWFKTQFTENDTFKNVVKMFNANPGSNTILTTTDKDGNTKNVTLAEAIKQYNDALGEYADNYEGISALRDFYSNNTGLTLTDDQIRISENTINKKDDAKNDSKVIYIPDSWNAIYDFKKLPSWDDKTKTVSAKDFFDVYNLDEDGSITEEQWQALGDAAEATLENAFSGSTASNLNTEDPDAVKEAGDRLAKSIAAAKTLNGSRPDISTLHATAIFTKSVGEQFVSSLSKTYGNIGNFLSSGGEWLASSPVAPISWIGERAEDVVALANIPGNAMLVAMGAIGEDIANGRLNPDDATDYIAEVRESVGKLWSVTHGDIDFRDYELATLGGRSMNEITETFDADIDYMTKISKAATGGKFVGNLLELAVEVWVTEATGTAVGDRLFTTGENIGRAFGLAFKGSKIKDQTSILTKLYVGANKVTSKAGNMMIQGFIDTIESDAGSIAAKLLSSDEVSEQEKQELYDAMAANTMFNVGSEIVISGMMPKFLETKPGRFVQTRTQKAIAGASLPLKKGQIALAKLINGVTQGKQLSEAAKEALTDELVKFGVNDLNSYNVKIAEANYNATKQIATAKKGKEYLNSITDEKLTASSTTEAIETTVMNKIYFQNMIDRVTKGTKAEMEEIIKSPDVFKANVENRKAATNVIEAESKAGKKMSEINGVATFAQDDSNYLAYKKNLDRMDRKEAILKAQKKELLPGDKDFQTALKKLVSSFETTNDPRLVAALNKFYESNMALNKALTDWEVKNGVMSKEVYESLKATGYFGADDEFYMHTIVVKAKGNNFTEQYSNAISDYTKDYNRRARESYRVDPTNQTDKHISKTVDPEARYLDPQLTNYARIFVMAQAYQTKNWGKALMGINAPLEPMDTLGKPTKISEVNSAIKEAEKVSATAIEKLQVDELQPIIKGVDQASLGEAYRDQYKIEERITSMEESEAKQLGIFDNKQMSDNVSKLGDDQIANNLNAIEGAPTYTTVRTYEEVESFLDEMPTKEMRAKAEKLMNTQVSNYDKTYKERVKKFESQKKERLAQATALEKEAKSIDSEIAKIEKANASGQAKYEKAKARAEKKAEKAAASRAKYEESLAKDNEFYSGITDKRGKKMYNDLYNDLNDASIDQFQFDVKDAQELDLDDAISAVSEARSEEVSNVFKKGTDKKEFINRRRELANLVDNGEITKIEARKKLIDEYVDKDYLNNARVKAFGSNTSGTTVAPSATAKYVEIQMPDPFVPTDTADKVAEAAAKREEATRIKGEVDALRAPRSLSDKQKAIKAWNDAVEDTELIDEMNRMWLQNAITSESIEVPEEVLANIKTQIAYAKLAENTQTELINDRVLASKDPKAMAKRIENWAKRYSNRRLEIDRLTEIAKMMKEGKAPFTQISNSILDDVISNTSDILSENAVGKRVFEMAKDQGVNPDLVKEYMSVNALLKENGNGDLVLRDDVLKSTKERLQKEMFHQAGVEKNPTSGVQKEVIKQFQSTIEETAKSKWATAQRELIDAGGNDFVDIEKNFNYVKKEMEKFVGEFNSANVIPMIGADGELKYYEVSPLVADLYMNRPIARYGKASEWFNKVSRISRVSKTNLNATSVVNQCFRDPVNAYIGAGFYKGFKAYENEMANRFGAELVSQLQESMSKAGWDTFTEGGTIAGRELEKRAAKYVVEDTGVNTFVSESTENALFDQQRTALRGVRSGALDNLDAWNKKYKKAKKGLFTWANEHTPGYMINEARETFLRKADYASAFNSALRQGKTVMEAKNVAEFVSRQATTNFGRTFMWGNSIVNAVPFLGAAINGPASFFRLVAMDPVGVMSRFTTAGLAMMSIVAQSMTTKRDRDIYKTIPEYIKQENLAFVYDGEVFKIPIPQEMGALLAPFRQAVEKSNTGVQNHGWMEILANDLLEVSPIDLAGFETLDEVNLDGDPTIYDRMSREFSALVSQLAPPLVKTAYMAYTGVDPYTGNPIDNSYKWLDADGNLQTMDSTQSSFANWMSDTLGKAGISKSPSFWNKTLDAAFGTGMMGIADWITSTFGGNIVGASSTFLNTQVEKSVNAVNVASYQLQDPYLREFKATINELEDEKNKLLSPDGDLALISQKLSSLKETDKNYETQKKTLTQEYMQKTEDYRQRVMNAVNNYSNHYGSTYTVNQFASVLNLLTFQESTLMPMNAYQDEQLSQMYYSAREQAYQTMIDMGFDSPNDWSIFGVARRNKNTGEIYVKYSSPTAILNMDNVAMGAGKVYSAELESVLKNAGLTKEARYNGYSEASAKGKNAAKEFKKEWNAAVANAIADTMYKYGPENVINSGDATELLNEYFYISNTSYKVKNYLEDVFGKED